MLHAHFTVRKFLNLTGLFALLSFALPCLAEHEHHHHEIAKDTGYTVAAAEYVLPEIELVSSHSTTQKLATVMGDEPVMLNFIFTTCNAICPIMAATFMEVQKKAAKQGIKVKLVSVSIDPEQDTPSALADFARKYHAGANWEFYTGDKTNIIDLQKAFNTYRGNKMNHIPITFMRRNAKARWIRVEGFASATDLLNEFNKVTAK